MRMSTFSEALHSIRSRLASEPWNGWGDVILCVYVCVCACVCACVCMCVCVEGGWGVWMCMLMRDEKEERSKQGHPNNKAKQHNTPNIHMYIYVYVSEYYKLTRSKKKSKNGKPLVHYPTLSSLPRHRQPLRAPQPASAAHTGLGTSGPHSHPCAPES